MSTLPQAQVARAARSYAAILCLAYAVLAALLIALDITLLTARDGAGVDFACFRAASIVLAHGGNPYDFAQLWQAENALYNLPRHLSPGMPGYYYLDRYYNPPLFATALRPLDGLSLQVGYAIYGAAVAVLAAAGTWLIVRALGWTRGRLAAVAIVLASPCVALALWSGQQSTLLLFALGAGLYALRRDKPTLAGALLALGWVKPHLLLPIALALPLVLSSRRAAVRYYGGFLLATLLGLALTVATTGIGSITAWLHTLFAYTGYADAIQQYMPSLSGMGLILLPHPWNRLVALAFMALGAAVMLAVIARAPRLGGIPWPSVGLLVAAWLLFTPFAHANDDVLLALPLAVAWSHDRSRGIQPWLTGTPVPQSLPPRRSPTETLGSGALPILALWAWTALPLSFLLPRPFSLLGILPAALVFAAVARARLAESPRPA